MPKKCEEKFEVPTVTDARGVKHHRVTDLDLMTLKFYQASIIGSQAAAAFRSLEAERTMEHARRKAEQLNAEAKELTQDIHTLADTKKRYLAEMSTRYGFDFVQGGAQINLETGVITKRIEGQGEDPN